MLIYRCTFNKSSNYFRFGLLKNNQNGNNKMEENDAKYTLYHKTKRRENKLKYIIDSLYDNPSHMITVNCQSDDIEFAIKNFNKFATRIREKFSECWFIWRMDYNHGHLHYHLIGDFGEDEPSVDYQDWIEGRWEKIWKELKKNAVKVNKINDSAEDKAKAKNYMTKKSRHNDDMKLNEMLGKKWSFGFINKRCVPMHDDQYVHIDRNVYKNQIKPLLIKDTNMQHFDDVTKRKARINEIKRANYISHKFYDSSIKKEVEEIIMKNS